MDVLVAKAQDPVVTTGQALGYLFSGIRLTMKPTDWLEVGLSRGLQTGGAGRPGGVKNFVKAFLGKKRIRTPTAHSRTAVTNWPVMTCGYDAHSAWALAQLMGR